MTLPPESIPEPFFADTEVGRRFAIVNRPENRPRGSVLFIPPFAEEMNKSRRMTALAAAALARDGWLVLRFDLYGCGDSDGNFADTTWQSWLQDLDFWIRWLREESGAPPLLWGLRAGALLASAWIEQSSDTLPLLLWQPVANGQRYLTQFLRLRVAADMMNSKHTKNVVSQLWKVLEEGSSITVAGYTLNPSLISPMSDARLSLPDTYGARVAVLEISSAETPALSPATQATVQKWRGAGIRASAETVAGPPFWQTTEIETAPSALEASVKMINRLLQ